MRIGIFIISILFCSNANLFAQQKREFEKKINEQDVPIKAVDFVKRSFVKTRGLNWYEELSSGKQSFEAKFKYNGKWYSVEFDPNGLIEDIEIRMKISELPQELQSKLLSYLNSNYQKHKFIKIQEQWSGKERAMMKAVQTKDLSQITIRYEIEFYGKNEQEDAMWEGLFDQGGNLIERREIILRPTDNLLY